MPAQPPARAVAKAGKTAAKPSKPAKSKVVAPAKTPAAQAKTAPASNVVVAKVTKTVKPVPAPKVAVATKTAAAPKAKPATTAGKTVSAPAAKPVAKATSPAPQKTVAPKSAAKAPAAQRTPPAAKPAPAPVAKTPLVASITKPAARSAPIKAPPAIKALTRSPARETIRNRPRHEDEARRTVSKPIEACICPFPADELAKWRELLITRRIEITEDILGLEKDAMEAEDGHTTPQHSAERGSDADLQDTSLSLAGEEKALVWQIDRAIRKIDLSRPIPFGICEHTREIIPKSRLQLIPWTPLSIEGATYMEENGMAVEDLLIDD